MRPPDADDVNTFFDKSAREWITMVFPSLNPSGASLDDDLSLGMVSVVTSLLVWRNRARVGGSVGKVAGKPEH